MMLRGMKKKAKKETNINNNKNRSKNQKNYCGSSEEHDHS